MTARGVPGGQAQTEADGQEQDDLPDRGSRRYLASRQGTLPFLRMKPVGLGIGQVVERVNCRIDQAEAQQTEQESARYQVCPAASANGSGKMTKTFLIQCRGCASFIRPLNMVVGAKVVERLLVLLGFHFRGPTLERVLRRNYDSTRGVWQLRRPLILVR